MYIIKLTLGKSSTSEYVKSITRPSHTGKIVPTFTLKEEEALTFEKLDMAKEVKEKLWNPFCKRIEVVPAEGFEKKNFFKKGMLSWLNF